MPFPHEHSCRLKEPGEFQKDSFRRVERDHKGKPYSVIMGRLNGETTMTEQAYRYPKDSWSADEARSHCREHGGRFEAAKGSNAIGRKEGEVMTLEERIAELEAAKLTLEAQIKDKDTAILALTQDKAELDKQLSIVKAQAQADKEKAMADGIITEIFGQSTLAEAFHPKVKAVVRPELYKKEDGTFDADAFRTAFQGEVDDWTAQLAAKGGKVGLGTEKKDDTRATDLQADVELGRDIARKFVGNIRSDQAKN